MPGARDAGDGGVRGSQCPLGGACAQRVRAWVDRRPALVVGQDERTGRAGCAAVILASRTGYN